MDPEINKTNRYHQLHSSVILIFQQRAQEFPVFVFLNGCCWSRVKCFVVVGNLFRISILVIVVALTELNYAIPRKRGMKWQKWDGSYCGFESSHDRVGGDPERMGERTIKTS